MDNSSTTTFDVIIEATGKPATVICRSTAAKVGESDQGQTFEMLETGYRVTTGDATGEWVIHYPGGKSVMARTAPTK